MVNTTTARRDAKRRIRYHVANLNSADEDVSRRAELFLIRYYGARALDELIEACGHDNPMVRFRAVWILGHHTRAPEAYSSILRLTGDPDARVRYDATLALGVLGDARAIEPLLGLWLKNDDTLPAAMAIGKIGLEALPAVEKVLQGENEPLRYQAVQVVGGWAGEHGDARCVELLNASLGDADEDVREAARFWLEELGTIPGAVPPTRNSSGYWRG